jgi:tRNA (guanine37-N1)-methyltransferase
MARFRAEAVKVDIITIFPGYFSPLGVSLLGKAAERGLIEFAVHDLRNWAHDVHRSVDDTPFGGGPGMVMRPAPWGEALDAVLGSGSPGTRLVVPTPTGVQFRQETAATYSRMAHLVFACGRYEGIDARFTDEARTRVPVDEVSIGDYVLSGGEPAVLVMIDAICRLLPGVLGTPSPRPTIRSAAATGRWYLLEGPVSPGHGYGAGARCPLSCCQGPRRHRALAAGEALRRTAALRPDLLAALRGYPGLPRPEGAR